MNSGTPIIPSGWVQISSVLPFAFYGLSIDDVPELDINKIPELANILLSQNEAIEYMEREIIELQSKLERVGAFVGFRF
ncbi:MAG: hypothetical protein FWG98_06705 [Candidatus Cloacimonetes bacterium]|nr:hypothetical protein [Candidatus Cloacimonadota bacterium]